MFGLAGGTARPRPRIRPILWPGRGALAAALCRRRLCLHDDRLSNLVYRQSQVVVAGSIPIMNNDGAKSSRDETGLARSYGIGQGGKGVFSGWCVAAYLRRDNGGEGKRGEMHHYLSHCAKLN